MKYVHDACGTLFSFKASGSRVRARDSKACDYARASKRYIHK